MSNHDTEILAKLDLLIAVQQEQTKAIQEHGKALQEHGQSLAELRGQMTVALQWLQSMDARFVALMHLCEPRKAAA